MDALPHCDLEVHSLCISFPAEASAGAFGLLQVLLFAVDGGHQGKCNVRIQTSQTVGVLLYLSEKLDHICFVMG